MPHPYLSEHSRDLLKHLRTLIPFPAVVAGGWLRDIFTGHSPKDIDVFVNGENMSAALCHFEDCVIEFECVPPGSSGASAGEGVEGVAVVKVPEFGIELQLIHVVDPLDWVSQFDAHCNMIYTHLQDVDDTLRFASPRAMQDASDKVWCVNPQARESIEVLAARADKFAQRGYTVYLPAEVWPELLPSWKLPPKGVHLLARKRPATDEASVTVCKLRLHRTVVLVQDEGFVWTDSIGLDIDDLGMPEPPGLGLWRWIDDGSREMKSYEQELVEDVIWRGRWRRLSAEELAALNGEEAAS